MVIAAGAQLTRKRAIQIKVETTKGTLVATPDEELVFNPVITPPSAFIERKGSGKKAGHTSTGIVDGMLWGECTFTMELRSTGSAALTTGLAAALQGCGMLKAAEVYTPESDNADQKSVSIVVFEDGLEKSLLGAMGNVIIRNDGDNRRVLCDFTFNGRWIPPKDTALPTINHAVTAPMKFGTAQGSFTIDSITPGISQFAFNTGNVVIPRADAASAGGILHAMITDRDPTLTIDMEEQLVANYDLYVDWLAGVADFAAVLVVADGTDDMTLNIPKFQYRDIVPGERNGMAITDVTGICTINTLDTGDDEYSLTVAAV